jgi:hypothetical protein
MNPPFFVVKDRNNFVAIPSRTWKVWGHPDKGFLIDEKFVMDVESRLNGVHQWGNIEPQKLIATVVAVFMERYEVKEQ